MKKMLFNYKSGGETENQAGNVLFLILIAVALFAALSYAVTQSTRSGSGNAGSETAGINAAQTTQYPASVKTAVIRMIISGVDPTALEFNPPADFADLTAVRYGVFHPSGGGATYATAPGTNMVSGNAGTWYFNPEFEIVNIGTSVSSDDAGNEYIAFLPGITQLLCNRINSDLGVSGDTVLAADASGRYAVTMDDTYTLPGDEFVLGDANSAGLAGQPYGCFENSDGTYVYYHMLLEQ